MEDEADNGAVRRRGRALPRQPVRSREELAALFRASQRRLRFRAHRAYRHLSHAEVDHALTRAMDRMLEAATGDVVEFDHPLARVMELLGNDLRHRYRQRQHRHEQPAPPGVPVDRVLGPLTEAKAEAVLRLRPLLRDTLLSLAGGERYEDIAKREGVSAAAIRLRVLRARAQVRAMVPNGNGNGPSVPGFLGALLPMVSRRLRALLGSATDASAMPSAASLVPIVVCSLFGSGALPVPAAQAATALVPEPAAVAGYGAAHVAGSHVTPSAPSAATVAPTAAPFVAAARLASHQAADETPEDVTLTSAATPTAGHGAVVAIGMGHTCACPVLMRSLDGGVTWTATDGPPQDATEIAVPPDYPRDPRIFAGVDAFDATGAPYVAPRFGAPFVQLIGLPPGHIAVSSAFDSGDPRVFSASLAGVWSLRLGALVPHLEVGYPSALSIAVATLATPPPGRVAVLVWAPVGSVSGTSLPSLGSPVFRCPVTGACVQAATLPVTPGSVVAGNGGAVVAYQYNLAYLSRDGGSTFTELPMPKDTEIVNSVALTGASSMPWVSLTRMSGSQELVQFAMPHLGWTVVAGADFRSRLAADLIIVDAHRVIAVLQGAGYRCTAMGTGLWLPRCPA